MRIDSHHHFWEYSSSEYGWIDDSKSILKKNYLPADLKPLIDETKIDRVISVQARQSIKETEWLLDLADSNAFIAGVVGWVPLASDKLDRVLESLHSRPKLRSVRHVVQDEPDDRFILGDAFNRGVARLKEYGLIYDVLIYARQLPATIAFLDLHPDQTFVLDHIAKPTIAAGKFDATWADQIREIARRPNIACKFSGVATEVRDADWSVEVIRPYWDVALAAFGPQRLMFGSDWPVCRLKTEYSRWVATVEQLAAELSADEQAAFWSGTATQFYRL